MIIKFIWRNVMDILNDFSFSFITNRIFICEGLTRVFGFLLLNKLSSLYSQPKLYNYWNHSQRLSYFVKWLFLSLTFKSILLRPLQTHIGHIWSLYRFSTSFLPEFTMCHAHDHFSRTKLSNQKLHNSIHSSSHFTKWIFSVYHISQNELFHSH